MVVLLSCHLIVWETIDCYDNSHIFQVKEGGKSYFKNKINIICPEVPTKCYLFHVRTT